MRSEPVTYRDGPDSGAVAVIVAIMGVFLTGILAFSVDLGNAYSTQRRLSTAADGAALAAAQELSNSNACVNSSVSDANRSAAKVVAEDYSSNRNAPGSALQGGSSGFSISCVGSGNDGYVTVGNSQQVDYVFGNLFGVANSNPTGRATARYGRARSVTGLRPFGLCASDTDVKALIKTGVDFPVDNDMSFASRPTVRVTSDKVNGACGRSNGNWGVMDFNGGSNPTGETIDWIRNGYAGEIDLAKVATIPGNPGAPSGGSLESAMTDTVGKIITLPIYDSVTANGNNSAFHITGFVSAQLCGWKFGNKSSSSDCKTSLTYGGASLPDFLELRFRQSFTVGEFANCGASCSTYGIDTIALAPAP